MKLVTSECKYELTLDELKNYKYKLEYSFNEHGTANVRFEFEVDSNDIVKDICRKHSITNVVGSITPEFIILETNHEKQVVVSNFILTLRNISDKIN